MAFYFSYFRREDYLFSDNVVRRVANISQYSAIFARLADDATFYSYYTMQGNERLDQISQRLYNTPEYYWTIPLLNNRIINIWKDLSFEQNTLDVRLRNKHPGDALILDSGETVVGKFDLGESLVHETSGKKATLVNTFPTLGYIRVVDIEDGFPQENSTFEVVGEDSGDSVVITNRIPYHTAPQYFVDSDGNYVLSTDTSGIPVTIREIEIVQNDKLSQIQVVRPDQIRSVVSQFISEMKRGN